MAYTSGSHRTVFSGKYYLVFAWQEDSYSVTNNTSSVSWRLYIDASSGYMSGSATRTWTVNINGVAHSGTFKGINVSYSTLTVATGSDTITHGSDGSKSFSYSYSHQINVQFSSSYVGTISGSSTGTLTTIPRATVPVFKNAGGTSTITSVELGTDFRIDVSGRATTGFSHRITYSIGSFNNTQSPYVIAATGNQYVLWNSIPNVPTATQLGTAIPNATSGACTITCQTYNGSTMIGTKTATITFTIPNTDAWKPTIPSNSVTRAPSRNVFDTYVNLVDGVVVSFGANGANGSTIQNAVVTFQGGTYLATYDSANALWRATTNVSSVGGQVSPVVITVTDSRGRTASNSEDIMFYEYAAPTNTLSVHRCDSVTHVNSEVGECMHVTVINEVQSIKPDDTELNTRTLVLRYVLSTGESDTVTVVNASSQTLSDTNEIYINGVPNNATCSVTATVSDKANSTSRSTNLSVGYCTVDFLDGGRGIAFGRGATQEGFDCAMAATFRDDVTIIGDESISGDIAVTGNISANEVAVGQNTLSGVASSVASVRTKQSKNLFRVNAATATIDLAQYATAGQSSGVYLILLRPWTVSLASGAVYLVSYITNDYGAATCIEPSTNTSLSISGKTVTITFPDRAGGMVAILGGPII